MSLFRLDTSIMPGTSASSELADALEAEWSAASPGEPVVRRHLGTDPLPADAWMLAATARFTPEGERTPARSPGSKQRKNNAKGDPRWNCSTGM
jgi:FMN-dependent NADH-azoreductase